MKFIDLEFEGRDAHALSTYICLFEQQFKKDPTDAAHQLHRNLTALAESPQRKYQTLAVRDNNIIPLWSGRGNGLSRSVKDGTARKG